MMWGYPYDWGSAIVMALGMLLWFGLLAVLIWALVRWLTSDRTTSNTSTSATSAPEILRQRYARGEIDEATFQRMRDHLETTGYRENEPIAAR
jgi:putative membrane protein